VRVPVPHRTSSSGSCLFVLTFCWTYQIWWMHLAVLYLPLLIRFVYLRIPDVGHHSSWTCWHFDCAVLLILLMENVVKLAKGCLPALYSPTSVTSNREFGRVQMRHHDVKDFCNQPVDCGLQTNDYNQDRKVMLILANESWCRPGYLRKSPACYK